MGIRLYVGDDLERLAERLAELLREHRPGDPFSGQRVVVPSLGMRHWLSRRLADESGICANIDFVFPADFVHHSVSPSKSASGYESEAMTWRLLGLLEKTNLKEPARYVEEDSTQVKAFGLAKRLARLFDQYLLYRPEFFESWPTKTDHLDAPWQQELWLEICDGTQEPHPAKARAAFLAALKPAGEGSIILFGIGSLPPEYLKILQALATVQDVHLLVTQPTGEIWDDLLSVRDQWRQHEATGGRAPKSPNGHPLLVSLGRAGQEFHRQLLALSGGGDWDETFFRDSTGGTLLTELQTDLSRVDLPPREGRKAPVDDSLQVHSCHSPLREVEVLHDQLLHLFQERADLAPHEVVVMTPDIEAYAPLIRAVFDNPEGDHLKIPYTIADRHPRASSAEVNAFLSLLEMGDTRLPVNEVLTRLETPAVRRRFGIGEEELELLYPRCQDANVNWGYDAAHRSRLLSDENGELEVQNTLAQAATDNGRCCHSQMP
jgi:exodeoxyribonuclease V gamma subunit